MFGNMMGKLQEMQQKAEEIKKRLDTIYVKGESGNGEIQVQVTGNREVKSIQIEKDLSSIDKEELEDLLIIAMNKALENANQVNESEMKGAASGILPNLGF